MDPQQPGHHTDAAAGLCRVGHPTPTSLSKQLRLGLLCSSTVVNGVFWAFCESTLHSAFPYCHFKAGVHFPAREISDSKNAADSFMEAFIETSGRPARDDAKRLNIRGALLLELQMPDWPSFG